MPLVAMASSNGSAPLLCLPMELLELIAEYVPPADLLSMRLVCHAVSAKVINVVARRLFEDRCFYLRAAQSVLTLENIADHSIFSKAVRHIRFSSDRLLDPREDIRRRALALPSQSRENRSRKRLHKSKYDRLRQQEIKFAPIACHLLANILRKFQAAGNCPALHAVATDSSASQRPSGHGIAAMMLGYDAIYAQDHDTWIYSTIRNAIGLAEYLVTALSIGHQANPVPFDVFKDCWSSPCWNHLTKIHVTLLPDTRKRDEAGRTVMVSDEYSNNMVAFLAMLVSADTLEDLSLAFDSTLAFTPDRCIVNCLAVHWENMKVLPHLRALRLRGFMIEPECLLRFLGSRRSTVRLVDLHNIKDNVKEHPNMEQRLTQILDNGDGVEKTIQLSKCWDGWRWLEDYLGTSINEDFVREVFGIDTGLGTITSQMGPG